MKTPLKCFLALVIIWGIIFLLFAVIGWNTPSDSLHAWYWGVGGAAYFWWMVRDELK